MTSTEDQLTSARSFGWPQQLVVKESKRHGRGVFVDTDIPAKATVCFYDGYFKENTTRFEGLYALKTKGRFLIGYVAPRHSAGVAQLINDVTKPDFSRVDQSLALQDQLGQLAQLEKEYIASSEKSNVLNDPGSIFFQTRRELKARDELLFNYGFDYWLTEAVSEASSRVESAVVTEQQITNIIALAGYREFVFHRYLLRTSLSLIKDTASHTRDEQRRDGEYLFSFLNAISLQLIDRADFDLYARIFGDEIYRLQVLAIPQKSRFEFTQMRVISSAFWRIPQRKRSCSCTCSRPFCNRKPRK